MSWGRRAPRYRATTLAAIQSRRVKRRSKQKMRQFEAGGRPSPTELITSLARVKASARSHAEDLVTAGAAWLLGPAFRSRCVPSVALYQYRRSRHRRWLGRDSRQLRAD